MAKVTRTPLGPSFHRLVKKAISEADYYEALKSGADLEELDRNGRTPLMRAVETGDLVATKWLASHADINTLSRFPCDGRKKCIFAKGTALHCAIAMNRTEHVYLLVGSGANVNAPDEHGYTVLHHVGARTSCINYSFDWDNIWKKAKDLSFANFLIENGADINATDNVGQSPLHVTRNIETLMFLVKNGARLSNISNNGECAIDALIRNFGGINREIEMGYDLLDFAASLGFPELAEALMARGFNGKEVLFKTNSVEMIRLLVKSGADIEGGVQSSSREVTPVQYHALIAQKENMGREYRDEHILLLEELGANVKRSLPAKVDCYRDTEGNTLLHYAKSTKLIQTLLRRGLNANATGYMLKTPLHRLVDTIQSCTCGVYRHVDPDSVRLLLSHVADINSKDVNGRTPLHFSGNLEISKILISHGADVNSRDNDGRLPIFFAGNVDVIDLLIAHGCNALAPDSNGGTVLHKSWDDEVHVDSAAGPYRERYNPAIKRLIELGCDVNSRDNDGNTPLHFNWRNEELSKFLIEHGAMPEIKNKNGEFVKRWGKSLRLVTVK